MKILIICDIFPPAFGPRMGYLCKYMKRAGWEPVVLTEYIDDQTFAFLTGNANAHYVKFFHATGKIVGKLEWVFILLLDFLFHYKDKKMLKEASHLLENGEYAGILCSTYRTFPLPAAVQAAKKFNLPVIADLRDIIEQYANNEFIAHSFHTVSWLDKLITATFRRRLLKDRNLALSKVDYITTVSPWHTQILSKYTSKVELIYNGYDPEIFYPEQFTTPRFLITYTGRLLSLATRDPQLLFEAIVQLDREKEISPETFRIQWFIDKESQDIIEKEVEKYKIESYMDFHKYIPASEIPGILNRSSILLQLANKSTQSGPKGYMTTKLFEAFAVEKPVLCVRSDEGCLEETINRTHTGLSARNTEEVYLFLGHHYREWKEKGYTKINVNKEEINCFSRQAQAKQFMELFTKLYKNKQTHG